MRKIRYITSDDKIFETKGEAQEHQKRLDNIDWLEGKTIERVQFVDPNTIKIEFEYGGSCCFYANGDDMTFIEIQNIVTGNRGSFS